MFKIQPSYRFQVEKDKLIKLGDHIFLSSGSDSFAKNSHLFVETSATKATEEEQKSETMDRKKDDRIIISLDKSSKLK